MGASGLWLWAVAAALLLLGGGGGGAGGGGASGVEAGRVLGIFYFPGRSHFVVIEKLLKELAKRGGCGEPLPSGKASAQLQGLQLGWVVSQHGQPLDLRATSELSFLQNDDLDPFRSFLDGAGAAGAVLVSFGSLVPGEKLPAKQLQAFLKVLGALPQRVVWRVNATRVPGGLPRNVIGS
ncbi:Protein of unknown function, partial [Gryllus bimaculatus]